MPSGAAFAGHPPRITRIMLRGRSSTAGLRSRSVIEGCERSFTTLRVRSCCVPDMCAWGWGFDHSIPRIVRNAVPIGVSRCEGCKPLGCGHPGGGCLGKLDDSYVIVAGAQACILRKHSLSTSRATCPDRTCECNSRLSLILWVFVTPITDAPGSPIPGRSPNASLPRPFRPRVAAGSRHGGGRHSSWRGAGHDGRKPERGPRSAHDIACRRTPVATVLPRGLCCLDMGVWPPPRTAVRVGEGPTHAKREACPRRPALHGQDLDRSRRRGSAFYPLRGTAHFSPVTAERRPRKRTAAQHTTHPRCGHRLPAMPRSTPPPRRAARGGRPGREEDPMNNEAEGCAAVLQHSGARPQNQHSGALCGSRASAAPILPVLL